MAEVALIASMATAAGTVYSGFSKWGEGDDANRISLLNASNLRSEADTAKAIADYNAENARRQGEFQAKQLERAAGEERRGGQIAAAEKRMDAERVLSSQRARAASSGAGGVGSAGVLDLMGDTAERGEYLAQLESYGGETKARGRLDQAAAARAQALAAAYGIEYEGEAARRRGYSQAQVSEMEGSAKKKAGRNAFIGSLLSAAGTAGKGYYDYAYPSSARVPFRRDGGWETTVNYG